MKQLLIVGAAILAQGPFTVTADEITAADAIYPKHVIEGWQIVDAEVPGGFTCAGHMWNGAAVVAKPPVVVPPIVPESVPMLNAQLEMIDAGWWGPVNAYIDTLPALDKLKAQTYLNKALTMRRDNYLVLSIPAAIQKTEAEVDALFIAAHLRVV